MKIKQLVTIAAFMAAVALMSPSAQALTKAQEKAVKKAVTSVPVAEMPAKAAELVTEASKADRRSVAVVAVRAAIFKSRSSAPQVVAAVAKAAPDLAAVVSQAASEMEGQQAGLIARAATIAAPSAKTDIAISVNRGVAIANGASAVFAPTTSSTPNTTPAQTSDAVRNTPGTVITAGVVGTPAGTTRGSANHLGSPHGTVTQSTTPIGGGSFDGYTATPVAGTPTEKDYTLPRAL